MRESRMNRIFCFVLLTIKVVLHDQHRADYVYILKLTFKIKLNK